MKRRFNKLHKDWRMKVLERDKGCVVCIEKNNIFKLLYCNVHHLIPHEFKEYEYDIDNGIALCPMHHTLGKYSAHKHPIWFTRWLRANRWPEYNLVRERMERL